MANDDIKRKEQSNFLRQLKKEIETLEHQKKYSDLINLKIGLVRDLKISSKVFQIAAPYVLTATIMVGAFKFTGLGYPFYGDLIEYPSNIKKNFDSFGNVSTDQQYESFGHNINVLKYYDKWKKSENGMYVRNVLFYELEFFSEEEILSILGTPNIELKDFLGDPTYSYVMTAYDLSDEEFNEEAYMEAIVYIEDTNDYIVKEEPVIVNATTTFLYIIATIMAEAAVAYVNLKRPSIGFEGYVDSVKEKYKFIDDEVISKKLEIKKDNYNRLVR